MESDASMPWADQPAKPVAELAEIESELVAELAEDTVVRGLLDSLLEQRELLDAVRFLSHALQPRDAVWWAWSVVARDVELPAKNPHEAALMTVWDWLSDPTDEKRRAAEQAADTCGFDSPAGCVGMAVFFAEGSLGPADLEQAVEPPAGSCAKAAAGAILLHTVQDALTAEREQRAAIDMFLELDQQERPWVASSATSEAAPDPSGYDTDWKT